MAEEKWSIKKAVLGGLGAFAIAVIGGITVNLVTPLVKDFLDRSDVPPPSSSSGQSVSAPAVPPDSRPAYPPAPVPGSQSSTPSTPSYDWDRGTDPSAGGESWVDDGYDPPENREEPTDMYPDSPSDDPVPGWGGGRNDDSAFYEGGGRNEDPGAGDFQPSEPLREDSRESIGTANGEIPEPLAD